MIHSFLVRYTNLIIASGCLLVCVGILFSINQRHTGSSDIEETTSLKPQKASKAARWEYIYPMLRSPISNSIPTAIRYRELEHARQIKQNIAFKSPSTSQTFTWFEVGPSDVGGRTRALAMDVTNPDRLLAGGVSGGLWESTNSGASWSPLNLDGGNLSVTYIAQDPRPNNTNIWYYASGEFSGNSASDPGRLAPYYGSGVYKSEDNGITWSLLPSATPNNLNRFDSPFDFVNRIAISPTTGTLYLAANALGIYRSTDGGNNFGPNLDGFSFPGPVLGGVNAHDWSDVAINDEGVVLVTLSSFGFDNDTPTQPGVYVSTDDGISWRNITPSTFPDVHDRSLVAFAPSNPDIAYIFTTTNREINGREDVRLHRINVSTGASTNLSGNLPRLSEAGNINTQSGYNMALAVKPDDENFVILGGTNVYRSRDGFTSSVVDRLDYWIGGYDAVTDRFVNYDTHHPDQHIFLFDPRDPDVLWNGNDGGVYSTNDITVMNEVTWTDRNQGYNVTQFYTVALPAAGQDPRIAGGSQDNGTPFLRLDDLAAGSRNISVGDGSHLYFADAAAYVGFQNGSILKLPYNAEDTPTLGGFSFIQPESATNQLFVTPFVVDPNDEDIMYYPAGNVLWRNNQLSALRGGQTDSEGSDEGWSRMSGLPFPGVRVISTVAVSRQPSHVLYYGASDTRPSNASTPRLYRVEDANTTSGNNAVSIQIPGVPDGAYMSDIAVNPADANEILVVFSNYDIVGMYHSTNGGNSFTPVEGNLEGSSTTFPGPSIRAATILPLEDETRYFVGTSTGLYSTTNLDGPNTEWVPEAEESLGNAVVWDVTSRTSDDIVAAASHGRGLFVGSQDDSFNPTPNTDDFVLAQNYPNPFATRTTIVYDLPTRSRVTISLFDLSGRKVQDLRVNAEEETGRHFLEFNAASLASGVYIYRLEAIPVSTTTDFGSFSKSRKMMINK